MNSFVVYLYVNGSGSITSVGEERELNCLLLFTCNYVVSVWRGSLFLWVLGMGYVILLWHSLSLPYNYFVCCSQKHFEYFADPGNDQLANLRGDLKRLISLTSRPNIALNKEKFYSR